MIASYQKRPENIFIDFYLRSYYPDSFSTFVDSNCPCNYITTVVSTLTLLSLYIARPTFRILYHLSVKFSHSKIVPTDVVLLKHECHFFFLTLNVIASRCEPLNHHKPPCLNRIGERSFDIIIHRLPSRLVRERYTSTY